MRDINEVIAEKQSQIKQLQDDIAALKRAAEILGAHATPTQNNGDAALEPHEPPDMDKIIREHKPVPARKPIRTGPGKWHTPLGDAVEQILKNTGHPLHLDKIAGELAKQDIHPTPSSLDSALRKDSRSRFKLFSVRTYGLKNMHMAQ